MKKILLVAMVAFAFMACNENGASVPSNDKKAVKAVTSEAKALIGETPANVDKTLQKAGFSKVEGSLKVIAQRALPARAAKKIKAEVAPVEVMYFYNMPENANEMSDEEGIAYLNGLFEKGKCAVVAQAAYVDDKLVLISTSVLAPIKDNINLLYTENSDGLFKTLPTIDGKSTVWQGTIGETKHTDHAQYVADIAAAQAVQATEQAYSLQVDMDAQTATGFAYMCMWMNPSEEEQAEMKKEEGFVAAMGEFAVLDYEYTDLL